MPDKIKAMNSNLYACHKMSGMRFSWKFTICNGTFDCQQHFSLRNHASEDTLVS